MQGLPVTIRTIDGRGQTAGQQGHRTKYLNPALGLRAIRWSLADPAMFPRGCARRAACAGAWQGQTTFTCSRTHGSADAPGRSQRGVGWTLASLTRCVLGARHRRALMGAPPSSRVLRLLVPSLNDLIQYTLAIDHC